MKLCATTASLLLSGIHPRAPPPRCSSVREAAGVREDWAASGLLAQIFGGASLFHLSSLKAPQLTANVFFKPIDPPVIAIAGDAAAPTGVAQLLRVTLTTASGATDTISPVAFIQNVAVAENARRQGVARTLVGWCEAHALNQWSGVSEAWLAVGTENAGAISLYESLGYTRLTVRMGNVIMRKSLVEEADASAAAAARASKPVMLFGMGGDNNPGGGGDLFGGFVKGLTSALESALDMGFPGQLQLLEKAEAELKASDKCVALFGADVTIGDVDIKESLSVEAGVQIEAACRGSKGEGKVVIGASRNDDLDDQDGPPLRLEVLRVLVGEEPRGEEDDFYLVEP